MKHLIGLIPLLITLTLTAQQNLTLSSITPNQGIAGSAVNLTATGTGFFPSFVGSSANIPGSTLIWRRNGVETRLPTAVVSSTVLTTTIPATLMVNAPGTAEILVENGSPNFCDGPCPRSGALTFTITAPIQLTSINPTRAPTRGPNGNPQDILLTGTGFAPNAQVLWQAGTGAPVFDLEVLARTSSTQIQARIPVNLLAQAATANIAVRNPGGQETPAAVSNVLQFTVFPALRLDRLDPTAAPAGSPNTRVTVFGQGFSASTRIGFRDASGIRTPGTQEVDPRAGTIVVVVGADLLTTAKTWEVIAMDSGFVSENALTFQVTPGVVVTSISPTTRSAGSGPFELIVNGSGFAEDSVVLFGTTALTPTARTATQLRVNVTPPAAAGTVGISVRNGTGPNAITSNSVTLTFTAPAPSITTLSPPSRAVNSGDFDLTITGTGFAPSPTVSFAGQTVSIVGSSSATSITVRIPNARIQQVGNVPVVVRVNELDSNIATFQVTSGAPVLNSLSPASRNANSGDFDLVISGQNLTPNPAVTFAGQPLTIVGTPTATSITARVPNALIQQTGSVEVGVRVGNVDSNRLSFQVTAGAPTITSLNPVSRPAGSGDFTLTINGQNLGPSPTVTFGGQPVNVSGTPSATSVQVQVPNARIQQPGAVEVRIQVGTLSATSNFTVGAPDIPAVTVSSPAVTVQPNGNTTTTVALASPAPVAVSGTLELTFTPNVPGQLPAGYADPAMVFVSGGQRRLNFTVPAGQTSAQVPGNGAFNVGTIAGTVNVAVTSLTAAGLPGTLPPPSTVTIPRAGPSITPGSARLVNSTGGVTIEVQGFSPTREITQAAVTFTIASGVTNNGSATFTVPLTQPFTTWFTSEQGLNNGSRFLLSIPFTVPEGDPNQITGFSITLSSSEGSPATATGTR